ncbi:MAG TPA: hypothetical protein VH280_15190 [Verrucomicrobiae bacterium]|jgi:hypothetical protein|nr:hypothetical protein [Verrucomicrobiae bacterium]
MHELTGVHHGGEERREADETWARRLLAEELKREGVGSQGFGAAAQGRCEQGPYGPAYEDGDDNDP